MDVSKFYWRKSLFIIGTSHFLSSIQLSPGPLSVNVYTWVCSLIPWKKYPANYCHYLRNVDKIPLVLRFNNTQIIVYAFIISGLDLHNGLVTGYYKKSTTLENDAVWLSARITPF